MDNDDQIVFLVAGDIDDQRFARLGLIAAPATKRSLFEDLPSRGRNEFAVRIKDDEVEIVFGGFEKDQVLASILVQIAGDDIMQLAVFDGSLVAIQFNEVPNIAAQGHPGDSVCAHERDAVGAFCANGQWLPLPSRSQSVSCFRSASSMNREATAFVPFRTAVAPTILELRAIPLIWSFTRKVQVLLVLSFSPSALRTTARKKFFWARSNSGLPSPSTSEMAIQGCSVLPPGAAISCSSKFLSGTWMSTLIFS